VIGDEDEAISQNMINILWILRMLWMGETKLFQGIQWVPLG